jgi:uncharacterized membrane protein
MLGETHHFQIPRLRTLASHALPSMIECSFIPLVLFYAAMWAAGIWVALIVALLWSYGALGRRLVTRSHIPGLLVIGAVGLTARTVLAFLTGSVVVYFLQPVLTTVGIAAVFLFSVPAGRPLAERLAADFCPFPDGMLARPPVRRFFARITLLWAFVQLSNAAVTLWLLLTRSVATYMLMKTVTSLTLTGLGVIVSTVYFKTSMRRHGIMATSAVRAA